MKKNDLKISEIKFISDIKIYNELEGQKIMIFDLRSRKEFQDGNIYNVSINLPHDEISLELFDNPKLIDDKLLDEFAHNNVLKTSISKIKRFFVVIIMSEEKISKADILKSATFIDEKDVNCPSVLKTLCFYRNLINNKVREIGIYNKGFSLFKKTYPFFIGSIQQSPLLL
jgi:hypothetical protein